MTPSSDASLYLAIDSGSPLVSVAVGDGSEVLAERSMAIDRSSEALLRAIDETLQESGLRLAELDGLLALRGPGSFTGLRVGLATLLGLHQACGIRATAVPTLDVLACAVPPDGRVLAAVDALRGDWFVRLFENGEARGDAALKTAADVAALRPDRIVGQRIDALADALPTAEWIEPSGLAPVALGWIADRPEAWEPATLLEPLYLRPPATNIPG